MSSDRGTPVGEMTALVLPSGAIHVPGSPFAVPSRTAKDAVTTLWESWETVAHLLDRALLVRAALPDGHVDARIIVAGFEPISVAPSRHDVREDPQWDRPVPDRDGLRTAAEDARRAGRAREAEDAAARLALALYQNLGDHPYVARALRLMARCTAQTGDWGTASSLHLAAAAMCHRLGAPGDVEDTGAREAVTFWHSAPAAVSLTTGFDLAHRLLGMCPVQPVLMAGLLHALDRRRPARGRG